MKNDIIAGRVTAPYISHPESVSPSQTQPGESPGVKYPKNVLTRWKILIR